MPENDFFGKILSALNENPDDIRTFIFTGFCRERLTDFYFDYKNEDSEYHRYFLGFLLLKRAAMKKLVALQENKFRYVVIYAPDSEISSNEKKIANVRNWI